MSMLGAFLMLWGLSLGPATEAMQALDPPILWIEAESLPEPWANVTLTCQARVETTDFELFKDGVTQGRVHLGLPTMEHRFPLGAVTSDTRGLYRCRTGFTVGCCSQLSSLLEVTGAETLPPPWLSAQPVPWITPGLDTKLLCRGGFRGVTFLLRLEGDDQFLEVAEAPADVEAAFPVRRPGNYSCSYRTHAAGSPSEPSATVTVREPGAPMPPTLSLGGRSAIIINPASPMTFTCVAPISGVQFQLRQGEELAQVPMNSPTPTTAYFVLNSVALSDRGFYTCRYRLRDQQTWSGDSEPVELVVSDETLPAPELLLEPATLRPAPGESVQLRCLAPRPGLRFVLMRVDHRQRRVLRVLSPPDTEARFELRDVSVADSANYTCIYVDPAPPFAGSAPSAPVHLRVDGPPPRPRLRPLWSEPVTPGTDAVLRCESQVPDVRFELLRVGENEASTYTWATHRSADLVLTYVGPQHAGNYTCRYQMWSPYSMVSDFSEPVELQVAGAVFLGSVGSVSRLLPAGLCPDRFLCQACPVPAPPPGS
ncbi:alpha-1B-glycoprotein-like [Suricata suricatta]|uniref:Alpha-1-B glycoprotein n=1 Tax=Suricata suricatta TaxID=37032 RepID=A0A673UKE7_SURSU|nr:alpha-1B-glycoprotein-like [Suricata suricatta]